MSESAPKESAAGSKKRQGPIAVGAWWVAPFVLLILGPAVPQVASQQAFFDVHGVHPLVLAGVVVLLVALGWIVASGLAWLILLLPGRIARGVVAVMSFALWGALAANAVARLWLSDDTAASSAVVVATVLAGVAIGVAVAWLSSRVRLGGVLVVVGLVVIVLPIAASSIFGGSGDDGIVIAGNSGDEQSRDISGDRPDVLWVVSDELQYSLIFDENGEVREGFPNLRSLQSDATTYTRAMTPVNRTHIAIPTLLSGTDVSQTTEQIPALGASGGLLDAASDVYSTYATSPIFADSFANVSTLQPAGSEPLSVADSYAIFGMDLAALIGRIALAEPIADAYLPEVSGKWRDFWVTTTRSEGASSASRVSEAFTAHPDDDVFAFWHDMTTHVPWNRDMVGSVMYDERFLLDWNSFQLPGESRDTKHPSGPIASLQHRLYLANAVHMDRQMGVVLEALRRSGRYDDTLIVFTSDHGRVPGLRDTGVTADGGLGRVGVSDASTWSEVGQVPLLVKMPNQQEPLIVDEPRSTRQIASTVAEATGLALPVTDAAPGLDSALPSNPTMLLAWYGDDPELRTYEGSSIPSFWSESDLSSANSASPFAVGIDEQWVGQEPPAGWQQVSLGNRAHSTGESDQALMVLETSAPGCGSTETPGLLTNNENNVVSSVAWDPTYAPALFIYRGWAVVPRAEAEDVRLWCPKPE